MKTVKIGISLAILAVGYVCNAGDIGYAPAKLQAALFLKVIGLDKNRSAGGDLIIHVVGNPEFAAEMSKAIGKPVGKSKIAKVVDATELPTGKVDVLYIGDKSLIDDALKYTQANKVMSITGEPDLVQQGASLGVGVADGKLRVLLNISSSKDEDINWNPAILKIAVKMD